MSIEDEKTKELLETAENRIRTMALVHELLYQDEHLKDVSLRDYVETLTADLVQLFGSSVKVSSEIVDISLEMDILIPFGLLVNEIVTNALKYAFRDGHTGSPEIRIRMSVDEMGVLHFNIRDNGTGLPAEEQYVNKHSIGLTLIDTADTADSRRDACSDRGRDRVQRFFPGNVKSALYAHGYSTLFTTLLINDSRVA